MKFARLNHVLIPATKDGRDTFRRIRLGKALRPFTRLYEALSEEGMAIMGFWLLAGAVSIDVKTTQAYLLWSVMTGAVFTAIGLRGLFTMRDVTIEVRAPRRITVGATGRFSVRLDNRGVREHQSIRIRGPFLPWDGVYVGPQPSIRRLRPGERAEAAVDIRFDARGEHHLDPFSARPLLPFSMSTAPGVMSGGVPFLVVPRVAPVASVRTPLTLRYQPGGVALASRTGESMEITGVRPYRPGDSVRDLHAKSWARAGYPVVREYQQEYFTRIGVVLDIDGSKTDDARLEAAISLAAGVVAHLSRGEALIDLLVVGETVHELTLGRSLGFLEQALDLLACVEPGPPLDADRLAPHLARLSCVVFVSLAWDAPREELTRRIRSERVGCTVVQVVDERGDASVPREATVLTVDDIESGMELRV